jgi:FAD/FMN-containing dehydrogenase
VLLSVLVNAPVLHAWLSSGRRASRHRCAQVSAHGTGAALPPVDEQLVSLRVVSPGSGGAVQMDRGQDAAFDWVKVGLGAMGVVTEVTLQCVDAHKLIEKTFVATRDEVKRSHKRCALAGLPVLSAGLLAPATSAANNVL